MSSKKSKSARRTRRNERVCRTYPSKKGQCYGCGAHLQVVDEHAAGYVKPEVYDRKAQLKQLNQILCSRCHLLCNGKMVPGIADLGTKVDQVESLDRNDLLSPDELRQELLAFQGKRSVVLHLVDMTDVQGTLLRNIRDLVSKNPVVIIGTKMDLLPKVRLHVMMPHI